MKKLLFFLGIFLFVQIHLLAQEKILVIQDPYVLLLNEQTGEIEDPQFIDLNALNPGTPKGIAQIGNEIWITDQNTDAIYRFDLEGNYLSSLTNGMDNIKGLNLINESEVWVTNADSGGGAPGNAIVKFDTNGTPLGNFTTGGKSSFDVLDDGNGFVYISYISGGSPIEIRDYSGNFVSNFVAPNVLNFAQQINFNSDGNLLVANFSSPAGIYLFNIETGVQMNYWSKDSPRGVIELGDGSILFTNGSGIHKMNPATGASTVIKTGNSQYFTRLNLSPSEGCTTPTLSVAAVNPICEGSTATLVATSNGDEVNWYDSASSTTPIFTGSSFTTPALTANTSYWVQAVSFGESEGEIIEGGARVAPSSTSNSSVVAGTSPWGLSFTTTEAFTINSVDVYLASATPGNLVMKLLDESWNVIEETTVACPAGNSSTPVQFEVPLNFSVEAGNTYRLVASQSPIMVREFSSSHPGFPYPIGDVGTVTGGTINNSNTNSDVYYFFYNWTVQTGSSTNCESEKIQVDVTVNEAPDAPTGVEIQFVDPGTTLADLEVNYTGTLVWYADPEGTIVLDSSTLVEDETTYYVSQIVDGCESELFGVTVYFELGIHDQFANQFLIYPNPVRDILHISGGHTIQSVQVFDLSGKLIQTYQNVQQGKIDVRSIAQGTYLVRIQTNKEIKTVKMIKQ